MSSAATRKRAASASERKASRYRLDMTNLRRVYTPDPAQRQPIRFFCRGDKYNHWGLIPGDFHLVCPAQGGQLFMFGTDSSSPLAPSRIKEESVGSRPALASGSATDHVAPSQPTTSTRLMVDQGSGAWIDERTMQSSRRLRVPAIYFPAS